MLVVRRVIVKIGIHKYKKQTAPPLLPTETVLINVVIVLNAVKFKMNTIKLKSVLVLSVIVFLLLIYPYPKVDTVSAAGEALTINAPMTFGNGYSLTVATISASIFADSAQPSYFIKPAATGTSLAVAGSVGIGTTNPSSVLNVYEPDESTTLTNFTQTLTNAGVLLTTNYTIGAYTPGVFWNTSDNNATKPKAGIWLLEDGSGTDMYFGTSNSYSTGITNNGLVIDQVGNMGIGTTAPGSKLDINTTSTTEGLWLDNRASLTSYDGDTWLRLNQNSSFTSGVYTPTTFRTDGALHVGSSGARFLVEASGKVGIGTTAPTSTFQVGAGDGSSTTVAMLSGTPAVYAGRESLMLYDPTSFANGVGSGIGLGGKYNTAGNYTRFGGISGVKENATDGNYSGALRFYANLSGGSPTERLTILGSSGSVGIGTTAPATTLDVDGNITQSVTHGNNMKLWLSAARNGAATGEVGLYSWISEPSQTWTGGGIARNMYNVAGWPRVNTALSGQMLHFTESGNIEFALTNTSGTQITPMTIQYNTGNIGVGTAAPSTKLSVNTGGSADTTLTLSSTAAVNIQGATNPALVIRNDTASQQFAISVNSSANLVIRDDSGSSTHATFFGNGDTYLGQSVTSSTTRMDIGGTATLIALCHSAAGTDNQDIRDCSGTPSDLAEFYPSIADTDPGDIMTLVSDPTSPTNYRVVKSTSPYDQNVIGAVSTIPVGPLGAPMGEGTIPDSQHPQAIGLAGRVVMKVSLENGPISANDWLTSSSTPGVAMKATKATRVIGRALENYNGTIQVSADSRSQEKYRQESGDHVGKEPIDPPTGVGKITVMANLTTYDPDLALNKTDDVNMTRISSDTYAVATPTGITSKIGAFASATIANLKVGLLEVRKLVVDGVDILKKITELSNRIDDQQKQIEELKKTVESLRK